MPGHTGISTDRSENIDVRFGYADADTAVTELLLTAQSLLEAAALIEQDCRVVAEDWVGRFRDVFDVEAAQHDGAVHALADQLFALAADIRARAIEAAAASGG